MYFRELEILDQSDGDFKNQTVFFKQLDTWLASRHIRTYNYLTPNDFSNFSGIDLDISTDLFIACTEEPFHLLKERFDVFDKYSNTRLGSFYDFYNIPEKILHPESHEEIDIDTDYVYVYFELTSEPITKPSLGKDENSGKQTGITLTEYEQKKRKFTMSSFYEKD